MMNHIIVDVTEAKVENNDEVVATLLGKDGNETVSADQIADWAQTINYEVVANWSSFKKNVC